MFSPIEIVTILLIGASAGVFTGIMGGSGVVVVVPMLTLFLSFDPHMAIGTSLLINIIAAVVTSFIYYRHRNIYIKPALWIAFGSVFGAQAGSVFADIIPSIGLSSLFGLMLIPMGILIWIRGIRRTTGGVQDSQGSNTLPVETQRGRLIALGLGLFVGIMCGLFGAGGGGMVFIILIFVLHYPIHLAVGTSSLIMAITATSGTIGYTIHDNIDIYVAFIASVPTVLAAGLGASVANRVGEKTLGRIIGAILAMFGVIMIVSQSLA
jgi:hypothetical protein